jgi:hypothetical protein
VNQGLQIGGTSRCGEKTTVPVNAGIAPILPFMACTPPAPNPFGNKCDQSATISKLSNHGFESLTTRLLALDQNKKLN